MKTYAKDNGRIETNWLEELANTPFEDTKKWGILTRRSEDWPTCAVGNMCHILPRSYDGTPKDTILEALGVHFMNTLNDINNGITDSEVSEEYLKNMRLKAINIFNDIEKRSTEIINSIYSNEAI